MYPHLHNGRVEVIVDVAQVAVTDDAIVFDRGELPAVTYPRAAVYFTCCERDQAPPQF
jgi:hypothetical protein